MDNNNMLQFDEMTLQQLTQYVREQKKNNFADDYFLKKASLTTKNVNKLAQLLREQYPKVNTNKLQTKVTIAIIKRYLIVAYFEDLVGNNTWYDWVTVSKPKVKLALDILGIDGNRMSEIMSHDLNGEEYGLGNTVQWNNNETLHFIQKYFNDIFDDFKADSYWKYPEFTHYEKNYPAKLIKLVELYRQGQTSPLQMFGNLRRLGLNDTFLYYSNNGLDLEQANIAGFLVKLAKKYNK